MITERDVFPNLGRLTPSEVSRLTLQERVLLRVSAGFLSADDVISMRRHEPIDIPSEAILAITQ